MAVVESAKDNGINYYLLYKDPQAIGFKSPPLFKEESKEVDNTKIPVLCVVGPALSDKINLVTGKLKLL